MRIGKLTLTLFLFILLVLDGVVPALASPNSLSETVIVKFDNQTDDDVAVHLVGPVNVVLNLEPGINKENLPVGSYSYSYKACGGRDYRGALNVTASGGSLRLPVCRAGSHPGPSGNAQVIIENRTTQLITINFSGPATYSFSVNPGNLKVEISPGIYTYSYSACGKTVTGKLKTKTSASTITIAKCSGSGEQGNEGEGKIKTVYLVIINNTGATLSMVLTGPYKYTFYIPVGKSKFSVIPGTYEYEVRGAACGGGGYITGKIKIKQSSVWVWSCK